MLAVRLAEHKDVMLPVMVCQDGFITSHGVENVTIFDDKPVKAFVGEYKPAKPLLNTDDPVTVGPIQLPDYNFETRRQQDWAMNNAKKVFLDIGKELSKITGNNYPFFEEYQMKDAEALIIVTSSTAGTTKRVVDKLRKEGKKVGLLKPRLFRPFPYSEIGSALKSVKSIAVLDRAENYGANAPLYSEIKNALYDANLKPKLQSYVFGIGGKNIFEQDIENVFNDLLAGKVGEKKYIGVRE